MLGSQPRQRCGSECATSLILASRFLVPHGRHRHPATSRLEQHSQSPAPQRPRHLPTPQDPRHKPTPEPELAAAPRRRRYGFEWCRSQAGSHRFAAAAPWSSFVACGLSRLQLIRESIVEQRRRTRVRGNHITSARPPHRDDRGDGQHDQKRRSASWHRRFCHESRGQTYRELPSRKGSGVCGFSQRSGTGRPWWVARSVIA